MKEIEITDINGFRVGSAQDKKAGTGCTTVICEEGAVAGVDVRGGSPGTRETDALNPCNLRESIHAVLLAGGSAFGLDAAGGVMRFLEEKGVGRDVAVTKVPIVCGAILFDLKCGDYKIRPDQKMGYDACQNAYLQSFCQGNFGAGTGATVGKTKGTDFAMKGGLGMACYQVGELKVGAIMAVNCVGDIFDQKGNRLIAGALSDDKKSLVNSEEIMLANYEDKTDFFSENTIIGTVITNAKLSKAQVNKLASVSHNGIARAVRPAHTVFDGDTIFTMAAGKVEANVDVVGIMAVRAVEQAILNAVEKAETAYGYKSYQEIRNSICKDAE
jgi:L-aminopeptidase/D-esterase-like protein